MTVWKTVDDWTYEYFELDSPNSNFPGFEEILDIWNSKRKGNAIPAWSAFDFYDFRGWHGHVNLATISYDPFDYQYKIFGSKSVDALNSEWTGKTGIEIAQTHERTDLELEFYEMTTKNFYISRASGLLPWEGRGHRYAAFLELPLSDDGTIVTHTLEIIL